MRNIFFSRLIYHVGFVFGLISVAVTEVRCLDKYKQKDKYMRYMLNPY